jgi:NTP pyrophosphatase (non-canonical NTP hydrolase)
MNKKQELLTITMEECGELIQACSKLIRFEKDSCPDDLSNLQDEIGDLFCMIELIKQEGLVNEEKIKERMEVKKEKLKKWSNLFNEV